VRFDALFTIQSFALILALILALIFPPPFFFLGVIEFIVFKVISCRLIVFTLYS
jgi:hypothetical protein